MTKKQRDIYAMYVYNQRTRLEQEIENLQQKIRWRHVSQVDCLELIIAQERYNSFCEFITNVNSIFEVDKYDKKHNSP
ncbi:MAG: hypothetical protein IJ368_09475 [Oscillospiraceae bacterium]|nr:hypothetical protein [Oscillospiraceae bacterium]